MEINQTYNIVSNYNAIVKLHFILLNKYFQCFKKMMTHADIDITVYNMY